jgi:hypothetical protein
VIDAHFVLDQDLNASAKNQLSYTLVKLVSNPKLPADVPHYLNAIPVKKYIDNVPVLFQPPNAMYVINQSQLVVVTDLNQNQFAPSVIKNLMPVDANNQTQDQFV